MSKEPVAWTEQAAINAAHSAGFAGTSWIMGPEELALLLNRAQPPAQQEPDSFVLDKVALATARVIIEDVTYPKGMGYAQLCARAQVAIRDAMDFARKQ